MGIQHDFEDGLFDEFDSDEFHDSVLKFQSPEYNQGFHDGFDDGISTFSGPPDEHGDTESDMDDSERYYSDGYDDGYDTATHPDGFRVD